MSEHPLEYLGAYLDGELSGGQLRKLETHLKECRACQEEVRSLQTLSSMLHSAPLPDFPAAERIAGEVALRLPRIPAKPASRRAMELGWWLAPVGLILAWVFFSTTILVRDALATAHGLGLLSSAFEWLAAGSAAEAYWSGTLGQFGLLAGDSLQWAEATEAFTRMALPQITLQVSIALLYLSWLAIWWARHTRQEPEGLG